MPVHYRLKYPEQYNQRQRQIDLQKAQYNLESMKNQRTILQYSREKGLHYVADESAIRDAQEKVDEAEFDIEVARKENEIRLIEQEIDLLEEQKEAIQDQISVFRRGPLSSHQFLFECRL